MYLRLYVASSSSDNTLATFSQNGNISQEDSYYPFGMSIKSLSHTTLADNDKNKYLYNGKEFDEDFGLNWYDYGARFYDVQLGRWHVSDPLAENAPSWSPYRYGFNNPIMFIDPNGMFEDWWIDFNDGGLIHAEGDKKPTGVGSGNYMRVGSDGMFGDIGKQYETSGETFVAPGSDLHLNIKIKATMDKILSGKEESKSDWSDFSFTMSGVQGGETRKATDKVKIVDF